LIHHSRYFVELQTSSLIDGQSPSFLFPNGLGGTFESLHNSTITAFFFNPYEYLVQQIELTSENIVSYSIYVDNELVDESINATVYKIRPEERFKFSFASFIKLEITQTINNSSPSLVKLSVKACNESLTSSTILTQASATPKIPTTLPQCLTETCLVNGSLICIPVEEICNHVPFCDTIQGQHPLDEDFFMFRRDQCFNCAEGELLNIADMLNSNILGGDTSLKDADFKIFSVDKSEGVSLKLEDTVMVKFELLNNLKKVSLQLERTAEVVITVTEEKYGDRKLLITETGDDEIGYLIEANDLEMAFDDKIVAVMVEITSPHLENKAYNLVIQGCFGDNFHDDVLKTTPHTTMTRPNRTKTTAASTTTQLPNLCSTDLITFSDGSLKTIYVRNYGDILNPDDLLVTGNGYNFNTTAEEITILFKENLMPIVTQVNVQKESNVDSYIVMMMTTENVLIKFMNPSDVVYNKEKIKQIEILFVNTTDNLPIRNVKIELKGCHRESTDVKSATTEALSMSTTTYLVNTTCEEAAVYTDILLDRNAVEEINDEADRTIDLLD